MASDRTRELLFPITILASVAVGVVIGGVFGRSQIAGSSPSSTDVADSKAIVDAVDAVRAELVRVRERLDASAVSVAQPARSETRSTAAPDATTEIQKATSALVKAADSLRSAIAGFGGGSAPLVTPRTVNPVVWGDLEQQSFAESTKTYLLWNYQQVLDRFGPPAQVDQSGPGRTSWVYRHGEKKTTFFRFIDGLVAAVETDG
jgi:hypothetical protein